jgi:hypothetical protein
MIGWLSRVQNVDELSFVITPWPEPFPYGTRAQSALSIAALATRVTGFTENSRRASNRNRLTSLFGLCYESRSEHSWAPTHSVAKKWVERLLHLA